MAVYIQSDIVDIAVNLRFCRVKRNSPGTKTTDSELLLMNRLVGHCGHERWSKSPTSLRCFVIY